ncbi:MAG TPA: hypothetical protein DF613_14180 [Lachnospiraceae bacterium]|nr:hypothetical protein [Lachnospiraceae bacterium]
MKTRKKILAMLLAGMMVLGLAACGGSSNSSSQGGETAEAGSSGEESKKSEVSLASTPEESAPASEASGTDSSDKKIKIGYVCYDYTIEIWAQITEALVETCESYGWEITTITCDNNAEKQVAAFENFIQAGVDGIISSCENGDSVMEITQEAIDQGIPVVGLFYPYDALCTYSGVDLYDTGYACGEAAAAYMNEYLQDDDDIQVIIYDWPYNEGLLDRSKGMIEGFEQNAKLDYNIVSTQYATSEDDGLTVTETVLQAYPDVDIIISQGSSSLIGAVTALEAAQVPTDSVRMFAADTTVNVLKLMQEGKYIWGASTYGNAHQMADPAAELMKTILETGEIPEPNMLDCFAITPATVDEEIVSY